MQTTKKCKSILLHFQNHPFYKLRISRKVEKYTKKSYALVYFSTLSINLLKKYKLFSGILLRILYVDVTFYSKVYLFGVLWRNVEND